MTAKKRGFAFTDLILVMTILAILAAFAVPRFAALDAEARSAETVALSGYLRSSVASSHALWLAEGQPATVVLAGQTIRMINGYPDLVTIDATLASLGGFVYDDSSSPGVFSKTNDGSAPIANCDVSYTAAVSQGAAPAITLDTSGC